MSLFDDDRAQPPRPPSIHQLGEDLSRISVEELAERAEQLRGEIARIETEIAAKTSQRDAADQLFKR